MSTAVLLSARGRSSVHAGRLQWRTLVALWSSAAWTSARELATRDEGPDVAHSRRSFACPAAWSGIVCPAGASQKSWNHNEFVDPLRTDTWRSWLPPDARVPQPSTSLRHGRSDVRASASPSISPSSIPPSPAWTGFSNLFLSVSYSIPCDSNPGQPGAWGRSPRSPAAH